MKWNQKNTKIKMFYECFQKHFILIEIIPIVCGMSP